jgi:short subunit dehydrogenase-like uncharacterized protein
MSLSPRLLTKDVLRQPDEWGSNSKVPSTERAKAEQESQEEQRSTTALATQTSLQHAGTQTHMRGFIGSNAPAHAFVAALVTQLPDAAVTVAAAAPQLAVSQSTSS